MIELFFACGQKTLRGFVYSLKAPPMGVLFEAVKEPYVEEGEHFFEPSPGGEGAQCAHWADEVEGEVSQGVNPGIPFPWHLHVCTWVF